VHSGGRPRRSSSFLTRPVVKAASHEDMSDLITAAGVENKNVQFCIKRIAIVAVARKLLVALWRYVTQGMVPEGAELKA
jgi:hypothetical protein